MGLDMRMPEGSGFSNDVQLVQRRLSVVIPVYCSETILPELVRRLEPVLSATADNFELVLVNDSSPDRSWDVICRLAAAISVDSPHQPDAQLRPAQCSVVRHPGSPL